ncbi:Sterile alpha motif domain [Trinorchestia longiramus]|nr:Sterile alpha motif domain [Trinorchestia longiramus]
MVSCQCSKNVPSESALCQGTFSSPSLAPDFGCCECHPTDRGIPNGDHRCICGAPHSDGDGGTRGCCGGDARLQVGGKNDLNFHLHHHHHDDDDLPDYIPLWSCHTNLYQGRGDKLRDLETNKLRDLDSNKLRDLDTNKLRDLESNKSSLELQVSVLAEQVEAQAEKIAELEAQLHARSRLLVETEEKLQKEVMAVSGLETQRLQLLSELSNLQLQHAAASSSAQHGRSAQLQGAERGAFDATTSTPLRSFGASPSGSVSRDYFSSCKRCIAVLPFRNIYHTRHSYTTLSPHTQLSPSRNYLPHTQLPPSRSTPSLTLNSLPHAQLPPSRSTPSHTTPSLTNPSLTQLPPSAVTKPGRICISVTVYVERSVLHHPCWLTGLCSGYHAALWQDAGDTSQLHCTQGAGGKYATIAAGGGATTPRKVRYAPPPVRTISADDGAGDDTKGAPVSGAQGALSTFGASGKRYSSAPNLAETEKPSASRPLPPELSLEHRSSSYQQQLAAEDRQNYGPADGCLSSPGQSSDSYNNNGGGGDGDENASGKSPTSIKTLSSGNLHNIHNLQQYNNDHQPTSPITSHKPTTIKKIFTRYIPVSVLLPGTFLSPPCHQVHPCFHPVTRYIPVSTLSPGTSLSLPCHQIHPCFHPVSRLRRSSSGHARPTQETSPPSGGRPEELRRGGVRATATARLGWGAPLSTGGLGTWHQPSSPFESWSGSECEGWLGYLGLAQYSAALRCWLGSDPGHHLSRATSAQLDKQLGVRHPLHRKKLQLAIEARMGVDGSGSPSFSGVEGASASMAWMSQWLDDVGLPQYKEVFHEARVDPRVLNVLTWDDLAFLKVTSLLHALSLKRGVQVLREHDFDSSVLLRRSNSSPPSRDGGANNNNNNNNNNARAVGGAAEVCLWTNHRVMEWLRTVDLSEYAPNLRGSGVHGALLVYEVRFNSEVLAALLSIPASKTLLRRHLNTHFKELVGREVVQEKRQMEDTPGYSPLTTTIKVKLQKRSQFSLKRRSSSRSRGGHTLEFDDLLCPLEERPPRAAVQTALQNSPETRLC